MKTYRNISLIETNAKKQTLFNSALEKARYSILHKDAIIYDNYGLEPLYMVIDTSYTGFCLNPQKGITYNEAVDLIDRYL